MKTFLALLALGFICTAGDVKWYRTAEAASALRYDGTGRGIEFDPGDVFPVSRVLKRAELDREQQGELPPAEAYLVIPLASKTCAIAPAPRGQWVDAGDPVLAAKVAEWRRFDAELLAKSKPKLHRRYSSNQAEAAFLAGRLPEYQAAMAAEAARAELIEAQRRTAEEVERLRRAVESRRR